MWVTPSGENKQDVVNPASGRPIGELGIKATGFGDEGGVEGLQVYMQAKFVSSAEASPPAGAPYGATSPAR
jgi:hypothetical protein